MPLPLQLPAWQAISQDDPRLALLLLAGIAAGVGAFFQGFRVWRRLRLIQDTPTSKVRSLALGRVELHGRAEEKAALESPFTSQRCVWYRWKVEEEVESNRRRRWRTLASGDSAAWPFYLEDETGRVLVDPRGARVEIDADYRETNPDLSGPASGFLAEQGVRTQGFLGFGRRLRLSEWHIGPGDTLFVLGLAQERGGLVHERRVRIAEKLAALKADADAMAHMDTDGDGRVSAEEWEVARRLAVGEVETEGFEDRVVVGAAAGGGPFYIADRSEREVLRKHGFGALAGVFGGALLAVACLGGLLFRLGVIGR